MNAGMFSSAPRSPRALRFCAALALAATPLLGCSGQQRHENMPSPSDTSTPASGARTGYETGKTGNTSGTGTTTGTGATGMGTGTTTGTTGTGAPAEGGTTTSKQVVATLDPKSGSGVTGTATFTEGQNGKVDLKIEIKGATAGVHAVHIHEKGDCSSTDGESAGPHWNPTKQAHGKWGATDYHLGDLGNLTVGSDGTATLTMSTDQWTIGTGQPNDVTGHAIVVHSKADDFKSQPAGAAGSRVACGVIPHK